MQRKRWAGRLKDKCVLMDRYEIGKIAGEGSFSIVFEGYDSDSSRKVAVKKLKVMGLSEEEKKEAEELFFREIETLKSLKHPGIPKYYDFFYEYDSFFLVMEWVEGIPLSEILKRRYRLEQDEIISLMESIINVLVYLQSEERDIVYKDLKPSNIMLLDSKGKVKVIDFGTARHFSPDKEKDTISLGTPGYAPPEAYRGKTHLSSDIYSFGATMYHIVTGMEPMQFKFNFPDPQTYAPELSSEMAKLLLDCLKDENNRIQNAGCLMKRFRSVENDLILNHGLRRRQTDFMPKTPRAVLPEKEDKFDFAKAMLIIILLGTGAYMLFTRTTSFINMMWVGLLLFSLYWIFKSIV